MSGVLCKNGCVEPYGFKCSRECDYLKVMGGKTYKKLPGVFQAYDTGNCKCVCPNRKKVVAL